MGPLVLPFMGSHAASAFPPVSGLPPARPLIIQSPTQILPFLGDVSLYSPITISFLSCGSYVCVFVVHNYYDYIIVLITCGIHNLCILYCE